MELNTKSREPEVNIDFRKAIKLGVIQQLYKDNALTDTQYKKLLHKSENNREIHTI